MGQAEAVDLDLRYKFDFTKPEVRANPYPYYRALLATPPVFVEREIPWAVISRYEDVAWVLADHKNFSSVRPQLPGTVAYDPFPGVPVVTFTDPPEHTRLHKVIAPALTPQRVNSFAPKCREIIDKILDIHCEGKREIDAQKLIAQEIPLRVFGSLRGMSDAECDRLNQLAFASFRALAAAGASRSEKQKLVTEPIGAFVKELIGSRETQIQGEDPVSLAIAAHARGEINDQELFGMVMLTVAGGLTTTSDAISGALYQMLSRPALLERVKGDRSLVAAVLEESLRFEGPVHVLPRTTKCDVEVGGVRIPERTPMLVVLGAAHRDPRKFANPDEFDIARDNVMAHLAFGIGIHFCIGAPLGRVVATITLERLLERFPRMRLPDGWTPAYIGSATTRGLTSLPVLLN